MPALTKKEIEAVDDLVCERVDVPEWSKNGEGGYVFVRMLAGDELESLQARAKGDVLSGARIAATSLCDEKGVRLFADAEASKLGKKSQRALTRVVEAALHVNGLSEEAREELEKN